MGSPTLERLSNILQRELGAAGVRIVAPDDGTEEGEDDANAICWDLNRGKRLVVTFATPPDDREERRARLGALVGSFSELFAEAAAEVTRRPRPAPAEALSSELAALAGRSGALSALIIDATSPVVWGASEGPSGSEDPAADARLSAVFARARAEGVDWTNLLGRPAPPPGPGEPRKEAAPEENGRRLRLVPPVDDFAPLAPGDRELLARYAQLARAAIARVRRHPTLAELHHGKHLHEAVREDGFGYLARSFATIYVLLLVYGGPFDELRAERAVLRALPSIERLVVSLPPGPDDATPNKKGAVVRLRPRRR
ncbi:hypothetical protein [Polyangium aurulentum]|uniref:hypothetical protein n=1 Tax=Polyangium aurulentum TaxID=2567896 RepID=UPI0010AE55AE|nr:hypothetical protein [Polyangium aurulentum]UQA56784.1 hypothetical protein E8A73_036605 [Polyangium aurulentum]